MATKASRASKAVPAVAPAAVADSAADEPVAELRITAGEVAAMRKVEEVTKKALLAEERVEVYVPSRLILGPTLIAQINGVKFEVALNKRVLVPSSVAKLIQTRVEAAAQLEESARTRSGE